MRTRKVYLLKEDAFTASQTKTIDLNVAKPVSSIDIKIQMTNGSAMTEASVVKINKDFTKIEIVDGANVLVSGSMRELQALNFVETGHKPWQVMTLEDNAVQQEAVHIHFGVSRNDPNHYLDPTRFVNPQIKITNSMTTAAATAWASSGHNITVIANVIEEGAGPYQGFLMTKSMYSFTAVSGSWETIDIPTDYPIRLVQVQPLITSKNPYESITDLKLTCDADAYVPVEADVDDLIAENILQFGPVTQKLAKRMKSAADTVLSDIYYNAWATVGGGTTLYVNQLLSVTAEKIVAETYAQT